MTPDPRYLEGIALFNRGEFFDAHDVWEELWADCGDANRRFYQSLIQAAVCLYHFEQGNLRGALKLFRSGRDYMAAYPCPHLGLDREQFWRHMEDCLAEALQCQDLDRRDLRLDPRRRPVLTLKPIDPDGSPSPARARAFESPRPGIRGHE